MDRPAETQILGDQLPRRVVQVSERLSALDLRDVEEVRDIAAESFPAVWSAKEFEYFLGHENKLCFGIFSEVGGESRLRCYFLALLVQGDVDIISVATRSIDRRLGLAERLLERVCTSPTVRRAFLEVEVDNAAAIGLYEKHGFKRLGTRPGYYGPGRDAYLMCWERFS